MSHTPELGKLTLFKNKLPAVAGIELLYGPIRIQAKLFLRTNGELELRLPVSKQVKGWFQICNIDDCALLSTYENKAIKFYEKVTTFCGNL